MSGGGGGGNGGEGNGSVGGNINNDHGADDDVPLAELRGSVKLRGKSLTRNTSASPVVSENRVGGGGGTSRPLSVGNSRRHSRDFDNNHAPHTHPHANNGTAEGDSAPVGESRGGSVKLRGKRVTTTPAVVGGNGGGVGGGRGGGGGVISPSMSVNDSHVISFDEGVVGDYDGHAHNHRQAKQS